MIDSALNGSEVPWDMVVFVFGGCPELWGLEASDNSDPSRAEPSGALFDRRGKSPENSHAASLTQEGSSVVPDPEPMVVDNEAVVSSPSLPHPIDPHPPRSAALPELGFGATTEAMLSGKGAIRNITFARCATPISEVQAIRTNHTPPDATTMLLQLQDVTTFLSAFGILSFLPGSELSTILHESLETKESFKSAECEELNRAMAKVLSLLHELERVHGEYVKKLGKVVRHARQWHTWGLEVQYFYQRYGVVLSPNALAAQRKLFTFTNGFTALVYQLMSQHASFLPPEA